MRILALQLKRIGDLVLTTPALAALRRSYPDAHITLAVSGECQALLPALGDVDQCLVFRRKAANWRSWKKLLCGGFDQCLDFTGTDRSALFSLLCRAPQRLCFQWVSKAQLRALVYTRLVDSSVRDRHTVDHYLDLLATGIAGEVSNSPVLQIPAAVQSATAARMGAGRYVVIHPGTARPEKYWLAERWAAVISHIGKTHGLQCVITGGMDGFERDHIAQIQQHLAVPCLDLSGQIDLVGFAAVLSRAHACLSADTAAVHLAAAFATPQIALYGQTNPFHWRPRHDRAVIISAANPGASLQEFQPRMKGAPMSAISTELVIHATDALLAQIPS